MSRALRFGHRNSLLVPFKSSHPIRRPPSVPAPVVVAAVTQKLKAPSRAQKGTQRIQPKKSASKKPTKPSLGTIVKRKVQQVSLNVRTAFHIY